MTKERILVAMSGGVDSSVAAALLHEQGFDLVGVTMHLWDANGEDQVGRCCAPEDRDDARRTCEHLGIPHFVIDERDAFRETVIEPFLDSYEAGETPIPCVACNQTVKLGQLAELADRFGATGIATGHYAQVTTLSGGVALHRARDYSKDQSYFLFGVPKPVLERMRFPLGSMVKDEVRAHGRRLSVPNADKPDSQELCFVPDGNIRGFIERERGPQTPGNFVDGDGELLGKHSGVAGFTVGQRKGLGLGGGGGSPRYVLRVLPSTGDVVVGTGDALLNTKLRAHRDSWIDERPEVGSELSVSLRIRYRHDPAPATLTVLAQGFEAEFSAPQRAITPGQAVVVYRGDKVLGGGFIASPPQP